MRPIRSTLALAGSACVLALPAVAGDLIVPSGVTLELDTSSQQLVVVDRLHIEAGGVLRIVGLRGLELVANESIVIDGTLDVAGRPAKDVATISTGYQPEVGAFGGPAAGVGGTASGVTNASTPAGTDGLLGWGPGGPFGPLVYGAGGGESGYSPSINKNDRRPGGGGGGALAADQPVSANPQDPANLGRIAQPGANGSPQATGAVSGLMPPQGGAAGPRAFVDGDPLNDFWGVKRGPQGAIVGEATEPLGGSGGGAGGDAVQSAVFPNPNWGVGPNYDEKGGAGGGGGGLAILRAPLVVGPAGAIRIDGGRGASGENTINLDHVGGGGGGGSGGWLVLQARRFDLSAAGAQSITALGGQGGRGAPDGTNAGGNGGPGVIQLHTRDGTEAAILLPPNLALDDITAPRAHVLLPIP